MAVQTPTLQMGGAYARERFQMFKYVQVFEITDVTDRYTVSTNGACARTDAERNLSSVQ